MKATRITIAAVLLCTALASNVHGIITSITTVGNDNITLSSIQVTRDGTPYSYDVSELIGVTLTAFTSDIERVGLTNGAGTSMPPVGDRSSLLEDNLLTTGIINPAPSALGDSATVAFGAPVVNSFGVDIFFFEIGTDSSGGDPIVVTINGVTNTLTPDTQLYADGTVDQLTQNASGPIADLADLESDTFTTGNVVSQGLYAYTLDLSAFGVGFGDTVSSMSFSSAIGEGEVDPTVIGGFIPVPEPSNYASLTGILALFMTALIRRRKLG